MDSFVNFDMTSSIRPSFLDSDDCPKLPAMPSWSLGGLALLEFSPEEEADNPFSFGLGSVSKRKKIEPMEDAILDNLFSDLPAELTTAQLEADLHHKVFVKLDNEFKKCSSLVKIGNFAKEKYNNVSVACSFYRRAMTINPNNQEARAHYNALIDQVDKIDNEQLSRVQKKVIQLDQQFPTILNWISILREEFYQIIQQTCAIEDNPLTLEQVKQLLKDVKIHDGGKTMEKKADMDERADTEKDKAETLSSVAGEDFKKRERKLEIQGAAKAFAFVLKSVAEWADKKTNDGEPFSAIAEHPSMQIQFLIKIHQRVLEHDTEIAGKFYSSPNKWITQEDVKKETEKVFEWMRMALKEQKMDVVTLAAVSHHLLVNLHSFHNGNGRSTRAFVDYLLMIYGCPPAIIPSQRKVEYIRALDIANLGDHRPIVRFFADCIEHTADQMLNFGKQEKGEEEKLLKGVERPRFECLGLSASFASLLDFSSEVLTSSSGLENGSGKSNGRCTDGEEKGTNGQNDVFVFPTHSPAKIPIATTSSPDSERSEKSLIASPANGFAGHSTPQPSALSASSASSQTYNSLSNWGLLFLKALTFEDPE